jgi:tetratricopeptide (TPR) repeat protein
MTFEGPLVAKKIKNRTKTREEREAERKAKEEERARQEAGIQDDFQARGFELVEWVQDKQGIILGTIGLVVMIGGILGITTLLTSSADAEASKDWSAAVETFDANVGPALPGLDDETKLRFETERERAEKAQKLAREAALAHSGTGAGDLAHLYAGHASMQLADHDAAIEDYTKFLSAASKDDPFYFAGLSGRAAAYESKGQTDSAVADLNALVELAGAPAKDAALVALARIHLAGGAKDKAKTALDRFQRDFPDSSLKPAADELRGRAVGATGAGNG